MLDTHGAERESGVGGKVSSFCLMVTGITLQGPQGTNISHLGKRKLIFKMPFLEDMLIPWRVQFLFEQMMGVYTFVKLMFLFFVLVK